MLADAEDVEPDLIREFHLLHEVAQAPPGVDRAAELGEGVDPEFQRAGEGTRTPDRLITNQVLYQLSYSGRLRESRRRRPRRVSG
jgi:hypothetical protein